MDVNTQEAIDETEEAYCCTDERCCCFELIGDNDDCPVHAKAES